MRRACPCMRTRSPRLCDQAPPYLYLCERSHRRVTRLDGAISEEAHGVLRVVFACSYAEMDEELLQRVDGVAAVLYRLAHPRR
jgi:hypothetical protein